MQHLKSHRLAELNCKRLAAQTGTMPETFVQARHSSPQFVQARRGGGASIWSRRSSRRRGRRSGGKPSSVLGCPQRQVQLLLFQNRANVE